MNDFFTGISEAINNVFGPFLRPLFRPVNDAFSAIPSASEPYVAKAAAVALFLGAMLWVWFGLRPQYVNLDAPGTKVWHDLRFWTIASMAPHVLVYLYF